MFEFFQKGGPLMYPLLLCSVLTLTFSIERAYRYARLTGRKKLVSEIKDYLLKGEHEKAIKLGEEDNGAVAAVITEAIRNKDNSIQIIEEAVSLKGSYELKKLNEHLHILELIGRMAPLIGLLGTVLGMVEAFKKVAYMKGSVDPSILAGGIWEALITTVAGLFVAIPAIVSHHFFEDRVKRFAFQMKHNGAEIINILCRKR
ncbi:MAG: hypothetical protein A2W77_05420 [Nitrospinae bacterium RIFCSPLOWO2_12_39_16]|nr:MAG: hypothetical protein A2W77_05420 [Nitrospinae bacterium RIFCSPLOWO2_12_39_16]HLA48747.1 MotA/TolQ/ExbB proton channel family protein [Nitrospinota bacterium]